MKYYSRKEKEYAFEWLRQQGLTATGEAAKHIAVLFTEIINLNEEIKLSNDNYTKCLEDNKNEKTRRI